MNVYTMSGRTKGSIVERFNRTLKSRLERFFTESKDHRWVDVLEQMTKNINNTVNRSTGFKPSEVTRSNSEEIKARLYSSPETPKNCPLKIGDRVRIIKDKNLLDKGYTQSMCEIVSFALIFIKIGVTVFTKSLTQNRVLECAIFE